MASNFISRGFRGRRREDQAVAERLPPGQYLTPDFPVLSAGPTPHTPLSQWDFVITGAVNPMRRWTWEEFRALPSETVTVDIHCVTKWSKLDTVWEGVSLDTLFEGVENDGAYVTAFSDGGYTTNLPLADVTGGKAWAAFAYGGRRSPRNMVDRHACWCHISTSGRAPSGCAGWRSPRATAPASGSRSVITTTVTHGGNSDTRATELVTRDDRRQGA